MMIGKFKFKGGVHVPGEKERTKGMAIKEPPLPPKVILPLSQHLGAPAELIVSVGETVTTGQLIGKAKGRISANIHASLSGKVSKIVPLPHPMGAEVLSVVIDSDGEDRWRDDLVSHESLDSLSPEEIRAITLDAGIVGLGGAAFPTEVKLSPPDGKRVEYLIVNGAECEPFLTADHRIMLEHPEEIIKGIKLLLKAVSAEKCVIGIEKNKPDAIELLKKTVKGTDIEIIELPEKYPQGAERQLIKTVLNRELPSGVLPIEANVVVQNIGTVFTIYNAVRFGRPLVKRVITISGLAIKNSGNFLVRLGTPIDFLIDYCGGFALEPEKVIMGGPMTGTAQFTLSVPIVKGTSGIVAFPSVGKKKSNNSTPCIRCGRCINSCPIGLNPSFFGTCFERGMGGETDLPRAMECLECGVCTFVCPASRQVGFYIKSIKSELRKKK